MKTVKLNLKVIVLLVALAMGMPLMTPAQSVNNQWFGGSNDNGMFGNQSFGSTNGGGVGNQFFGTMNNGGVGNQYFGTMNNGGVGNQYFGTVGIGGFGNQYFGWWSDGAFNNQFFGIAPVGSGLWVLAAAGVGYAALKKRKK